MNLAERIVASRKSNWTWTFGGTGQSYDQGPFWSVGNLLGSSPMIGEKERIEQDFDGYVSKAFKSNGPLFTTIAIRQFVLSEARFQFQRLEAGRPGDLFGTQALELLETPWPNGTTGELLARMELDASLAGNFFATVVDHGDHRTLRRLRPDWVTIVTGSRSGSPWALDAEVVGYIYQPPDHQGSDATLLTADQVVHWSPIPDPAAQWRGQSWISPVLAELESDAAATAHKRKFFQNGAVSNIIVTYDRSVPQDKVTAFKRLFDESHTGVDNAYKAIHLGGGADAKMVGADLKQLDFKVTQGAGESRIAAASMVGSVMAQFSEGMAGSSLNAGNFQAARRRFADVWARPMWRSAAASLAKVIDVPAGARLWYDARDVSFLQEDEKDAAEIFHVEAQATKALTEAGYSPTSVAAAVASRDVRLLDHTGVFSVQLQQPGADRPPSADPASAGSSTSGSA